MRLRVLCGENASPLLPKPVGFSALLPRILGTDAGRLGGRCGGFLIRTRAPSASGGCSRWNGRRGGEGRRRGWGVRCRCGVRPAAVRSGRGRRWRWQPAPAAGAVGAARPRWWGRWRQRTCIGHRTKRFFQWSGKMGERL